MGAPLHEERSWMPVYASTILVVTTILLAIRLLSRVRPGSQPGLDDVFIFVAWLLGSALTGIVLLGVYRCGWNRHIWDVPSQDWPRGWLIGTIGELLFFISTSFTKVSVLLFYRRLVVGTYNKTFKWLIWAAIGFVVVYSIVFSILVITACSPVEALWKKYDVTYTHPYKCTEIQIQVRLAKLAGALSVITDFYSVVLPAALLLRIRISGRQRAGLMFIFGMGLLVVGAGIARTVFLARVEGSGIDKTWQAFDVFVAAIAECNVGIICACAPSLRSLFRAFFHDITSKISGKSQTTDSSLSSKFGASPQKDDGGVFAAGAPWRDQFNANKKESDSFKEAHEYGLERAGPVATGYEYIHIDTARPPELSDPNSSYFKKHDYGENAQRAWTPEYMDPNNPTSFVFPSSSYDSESDQEGQTSFRRPQDTIFDASSPSFSPLFEISPVQPSGILVPPVTLPIPSTAITNMAISSPIHSASYNTSPTAMFSPSSMSFLFTEDDSQLRPKLPRKKLSKEKWRTEEE